MNTGTHTVGPVSIEGSPDAPAYMAQYDPTKRWNGWLCPTMDAHSVVTALTAAGPDYVTFDFVDGVLVVEWADYPDDPAERIDPDEDGLYDMSLGWVWAEVA